MSTKTQAKPIFAATLTPRRSLTPNGKRVVVGLAVVLAIGPGIIFYLAGAWPVVAFMALDVVAIAVALTVSLRSGRAYEVLTLWPTSLELKRVDAKNHAQIETFTPTTVKFLVDRDYNERVTALWLKSGEQKMPLGAFLSPDEKLSLSKVFGTALRKARH